MRKSPRDWLVPIGFILWIFFVLVTFFAIPQQKPFSEANVLALGNVLLDLLIAGWLILVGLGLGVWLLQYLMPTELALTEVVVFGTGLGLGALGLLALGLGLVGLFRPVVAYGVTLALSVIVAPDLWQFLRQLRAWRPTNLPNRLTTLYLSAIGVFALLLALLPPTDWDGLFYHLTGPKIYLQAGRIVGDFDVPHFNFPSLMEMLFVWAMLLRGDIAAKLLHTGFGLLLAGLVYIVARRLLGQKVAWPAVLILASMPMLGTLSTWAYNDLALAFYQLASLYAVINYQLSITNEQNSGIQNPKSKIQNRNWLILSGLFAGLAMGLKYTSFITPLVVVLLIVWFGFQQRQAKETLLNLTIFSLVALLIALPWYLKNWAFTGNPVYPFLSSVFGGQYWDTFRADWYASAGTGIGWRPGTLLALPWLLTLGVGDANFWDGRTGPLLLLFLPLVIWVSFSRRSLNRPSAYNLLMIYVLAHFAFWTLGVIWSASLRQSRLLLPGLVGLVPLVSWVWLNLSEFDLPQFSLSRFVNITVGLILALTAINVGLLTLQINPVPYLIGLETREQYLTRRLGAHYAAMQQINSALPPEATVVFLWEPRSYYCQRDCRPDSILDSFPHLAYQYGSAEAIAERWKETGVSHVLIYRTGLEIMLKEKPTTIDMNTLSMLEHNYLKQLFDVAGAYQVYELEAESR